MWSLQSFCQILLSQKGEQNKAIGDVCICLRAECVCLRRSVPLGVCVCTYVLLTCARACGQYTLSLAAGWSWSRGAATALLF